VVMDRRVTGIPMTAVPISARPHRVGGSSAATAAAATGMRTIQVPISASLRLRMFRPKLVHSQTASRCIEAFDGSEPRSPRYTVPQLEDAAF